MTLLDSKSRFDGSNRDFNFELETSVTSVEKLILAEFRSE